MIGFFVPGTPRPQGSKRGFVNKYTGKVAMVESAGAPLKDWRGDVKRFAVDAQGDLAPLTGPVGVLLDFRLQRPKSHPKTRVTYPISRPDCDKLARSVLDALTVVCFKDDSQITRLVVWKKWAKVGEPSGCQIMVWDNAEESDDIEGGVSQEIRRLDLELA